MASITRLVTQITIAQLRDYRKFVHQPRYISQFATNSEYEESESEQEQEQEQGEVGYNTTKDGKAMTKMNWLPHPRNGIYFPEGHDWVMNDVPEKAASLGQSRTYWLRDIHGAEKHYPDADSADYYFLSSD